MNCQLSIANSSSKPVNHVRNYLQRSIIRCKDRVQALLFLSRVAGIVIAHLPVSMLRIGKSAPSPEVTAGKKSLVLTILDNQTEDILIEAIARLCRSILVETEAIFCNFFARTRCLSIYSLAFLQLLSRSSRRVFSCAHPQL